jgi:protein-S-isoprenylcysteine O-methyltransferase Ste14
MYLGCISVYVFEDFDASFGSHVTVRWCGCLVAGILQWHVAWHVLYNMFEPWVAKPADKGIGFIRRCCYCYHV